VVWPALDNVVQLLTIAQLDRGDDIISNLLMYFTNVVLSGSNDKGVAFVIHVLPQLPSALCNHNRRGYVIETLDNKIGSRFGQGQLPAFVISVLVECDALC